MKFYPYDSYEQGGGGGTKSCGLVLAQELEVLAILRGGGTQTFLID